ncbi:hypothetical protein B0H17DRAFT_1089461 [Mycena rosella]|uniref:Uncharacterized protein n=1 Tax=Mycena rosella TaxID=1033263 RepID=A0AAD7CX48_MYCRO|nr:hypothetical protein B0H17DRAFT_1089461 [Mycena rosella]
MSTFEYGWEYYQKALQERVPELRSLNPPQLLKLLDDIAWAGGAVFLDFTGLYERLKNASGLPPQTFLNLDDLSSVYPSLEGLYSAYSRLFEAVLEATQAFLYLASRNGPLHADPETTLQNFYKENARLYTSISTVRDTWTETQDLLSYEVAANLPVRIPMWFSWVLGADSESQMLPTDIPNIVKNAHAHLDNLYNLYESLEGRVKDMEFVWGGEPGVEREAARRTLQATTRLLPDLIILFRDFRHGIVVTARRHW